MRARRDRRGAVIEPVALGLGPEQIEDRARIVCRRAAAVIIRGCRLLEAHGDEWFARHGPPEREKVLEVIDGVYVAGSYTEFILHEYKQLLRIRSLLARGRATMAPSTPDVIARLFGGTAAASRRPRTRRSQLSLTRPAGVPDPIFWEVMEYWRLGDWRRPGTLPDPDSEE